MLLALRFGCSYAKKTPPERHGIFNSEVALAAIKSDKTVAALSKQYGIIIDDYGGQ